MKLENYLSMRWLCLLIGLLSVAFVKAEGQVSLPFTENFASDSPTKDIWTVLDVNADGKKWTAGTNNMRYTYHNTNSADDYLFSPSITLKSGKVYKLTFQVQTSTDLENLMIKVGQGVTPESQTKVIADYPGIKISAYETKEVYFRVDNDADYNISFYCYSNPYMNFVQITNVSVSEYISLPGAVTDAVINPNVNKEKKATLIWKNPKVNTINETLLAQDFTSLKIFRNNDPQPVYTIPNPSLDKVETWTDNVPTDGYYTYKIIAYNNELAGAEVTLAAWVGKGLSIPFSESFAAASATKDLWTIIDANNDWDGKTPGNGIWMHNSSGYMKYNYHSKNAGDDYLISPPLYLESNKTYKISYDFMTGSMAESMMIKIGKSATAAGQDTQVADLNGVTITSFTTKEAFFTVDDADDYYISFYAYSASDQYYIQLKNVNITEYISLPGVVTEAGIQPDANKDRKATLIWKNPQVNSLGNPLNANELTAVKIFRNNDPTAVYTLPNPVMGKIEAWTDNVPENGLYTYKIITYNNENTTGTEVTLSSWIGSGLEIPFSESFASTSATKDLWTIVDANNDWDGKTTGNGIWKLNSSGYMRYTYHTANAADDYLISPLLAFEGGKTYKATFEVLTSNANNTPENLKIKMGAGVLPENQTITLADFPGLKISPSFVVKEFYFTVEESNDYNLSFYCYSEKDMNFLHVRNLNITEYISMPAQVTDVVMNAASGNELKALLSWKNPELNSINMPLKGEDFNTVKIFRDNATEPVYSLSNAVIGKEETWTDNNVSDNGVHSYKIVTYKDDAEGGTAVVSEWIGVGLPVPYENKIQTQEDFNNLIIVNADNDDRKWGLNFGGDARYQGTANVSPNDWIITPSMDLKRGVPYVVSFKYYGSSNDAPQRIKLTAGTTINYQGHINEVNDFTGLGEKFAPGETLSAVFTPLQNGNYSFGLNLCSDAGCSNIYLYDISVIVSPDYEPEVKPTAAFTAAKGYALLQGGKYIPVGTEMEFTDKSSNDPYEWAWIFEGATPATSTIKNPKVLYSTAGKYDVTLTSTNDAGSSEPLVADDYINVGYSKEQIWNMPEGDAGSSVHPFEGGTGYVTGKNGIYSSIAERFEAPLKAIEISSVDILFSTDQNIEGTLTVAVRRDNGGSPAEILSSAELLVSDINPAGYTSIVFPAPVGISSAFYIEISGFNTTTDVAVCSSEELSRTGSCYAFMYSHSWGELFTNFGAGLTLNVVPSVAYSKLEVVSPLQYKKKNKDTAAETIEIQSNATWAVSSFASWIQIDENANSGSGNGTVSFSCLENESNPRTGIINVAGGGITQSITVIQSGTSVTGFSAMINGEEKDNVLLSWDTYGVAPVSELFEDVESHTSFSVNSGGEIGWTYIDVDAEETQVPNSTGEMFPNAGARMAFMVFEPDATGQTSGSSYNYATHSGDKYFASFCSDGVPNNDWIITPMLTLNEGAKISFWARSLTDKYGIESLRVVYSTTGKDVEDFTVLLSADEERVPVAWTNYLYDVPADAKYIAINCISDDRLMLLIDDIYIGQNPENKRSQKREISAELINQIAKEVKGRKNTFVSDQQFSSQPSVKSIKVDENEKLQWFDPNDERVGTFGMSSGGAFSVASKWLPTDLAGYANLMLNEVELYVYDLPNECTVTIYQNEDIVYTAPVTNLQTRTANKIQLTESIPVDLSKELVVAFSYTYEKGIYGPATTDSSPVQIGKNLIKLTNTWQTVESYNVSFKGNWRIALGVEYQSLTDVSYNIYRDNVLLKADLKDNTYLDENLAYGDYCYSVSILYPNDLESSLSESKCMTIDGGVGVDTYENNVSVYPNPFENDLNIVSEMKIQQVVISDASGRSIFTSPVKGQNKVTVNAGNWESGIYFVKVKTDDGKEMIYKVIKK